jgi:hypothetical protein
MLPLAATMAPPVYASIFDARHRGVEAMRPWAVAAASGIMGCLIWATCVWEEARDEARRRRSPKAAAAQMLPARVAAGDAATAEAGNDGI